MKRLKLFLPLFLVPCAGLVIVSGCGSGGGTSPVAPIAASSATPSSDSSPCTLEVSTTLTHITYGGTNTGNVSFDTPAIEITWTPPCGVDESRVVEYHVFRDNTFIGAAPRNRRGFYDGAFVSGQTPYQRLLAQGEAPFTTANLVTEPPILKPYAYRTNSVSSSGLIPDVAAVPAFTSAPHQYQVTVVYSRQVNNATEYVEAPLGTSSAVTPPQQ